MFVLFWLAGEIFKKYNIEWLLEISKPSFKIILTLDIKEICEFHINL